MHMVALQTCYVFSQRKEYREGQAFDMSDEREALSLIQMKKAQRVEKPKHVDLPKALKAEEPEAPKSVGRRGRYQRRDMTAEDGQIGEEILSPSSQADLQSGGPISPDSEEESAS